jgi:small subunit ribosomal protein S2
MAEIGYNDLLDAGVHFGHLKRKWNPKMAPYIFMERNGIHIIDLNKTLTCLETACNAMRDISRKGKKVLFVATKKQAKDIVAKEADRLKMPFVTERWLGGMLTNFTTVRKSIKKLASIDKMAKSDNYQYLAKREKLMLQREKEKLQRVLGGIADQVRLPSALFIVDVKREHIAVREAKRLGIPVFGIVDTNSDPTSVDFAIPANDDAYKSIALITGTICKALEEGLMERKRDKDDTKKEEGAKDATEDVEEEIIDENDDLLADLDEE